MAVMPLPHGLTRAFTRPNATLSALALSCAAALAAAGCSSAPTVPAPASSPAGQVAQARTAGLQWHPCTLSGVGMKCASLAVPLNYSDPSGRKITLALSMLPATAPPAKQQGDLLVNPGGPGGSGRYLAAVVAYGMNHQVASTRGGSAPVFPRCAATHPSSRRRGPTTSPPARPPSGSSSAGPRPTRPTVSTVSAGCCRT